MLRRLVTDALAEASGVRRSWPTAASSAVRIRSVAASGAAVAACSASRERSSSAPACAAKAPDHALVLGAQRAAAHDQHQPLAGRELGVRLLGGAGSAGRPGGVATTVHVPWSGGPDRSSNVTSVRPKASRTRSSRPASPVSPRSTLPASVPSVWDSADARAACRVRRAARSTTELTDAATTRKTVSASALLVSLMLKVCSGGVK